MQLTLDLPSKKESAAGVVARFRHDSDDGWTVAGTVSRGPNGHVISHLEVWPGRPGDAPDGSVTTRMLHDIRVGQIINAVRYWEMQRKVRGMASRMKYEPGDERAERLLDEVFREPMHAPGSKVTIRTADEILSAGAPERAQPGRAPLPDELLRQVAEGYILENAPGKPRGAVKRLAQQLGRSENTVSRWVARARKDGWLGPGRQGHEGAEPGPRLLAARAESGSA
jgi:transposase-like protein